MEYFQKEAQDLLKEFSTSLKGLQESQIKTRIKKYGYNQFKKTKKLSPLKLFFAQFKNFIVYILLFAALISFVFNHKVDAYIILTIVILNAIIGFIQEFKAENAIRELSKLSQPLALVIRKGKLEHIKTKFILPGDILIIEEGSFIAADARIIESSELTVNESILTGESTPVLKSSSAINKKVLLADQKNMLFSGTTSIGGRAKALVVNTGLKTEIGKIAKEIQETPDKKTQFQKELAVLGKYVSFAVLFISLLIFGIGIVKGVSFLDSLLTAIALAVGAIPEGLPAVITITLALGTQRMLKGNMLVRHLPSMESIGATTVICADKTGTMTRNEMTVTSLFTNKKLIQVTGSGFTTKGSFLENKTALKSTQHLNKLFEVAYLCNNSPEEIKQVIDPTETALRVLTKKANFTSSYKRLKELPFSSEKKYMATINEVKGKSTTYVKGAPEVLLNKASHYYLNGKVKRLTAKDKKEILQQQKAMAERALRVLGFAYTEHKSLNNLIFVGLTGMMDPPRETVKPAIKECHEAGIRVVMITGDHEITAKAIAQQIGITGETLTGKELQKLSLQDLTKKLETTNIYARVTPEHKSKILLALQKQGHLVTMSGDGVNDAPALTKADIGVAIGAGTDVAKQAADMVIVDNNFSSIVHAVKEGRRIFDNVKKFINYLFTSNIVEVAVVLVISLWGLQALTAAQLLWINLLTDGLPALALGVDPAVKNIMKKQPRKKQEKILDKVLVSNIFAVGFIKTILLLAIFFHTYKTQGLLLAQTMVFTGLVIFELVRIAAIRFNEELTFFSNKWLLLAMALSLLLQGLVLYTPLSAFFKTSFLGLSQWLILLPALAIAFLSTVVVTKFITKYYAKFN